MKSLSGIPGPPPLFPAGNLHEFLGRNPSEVCEKYSSSYGPMTLIWIFGKPCVVLNDPDLIGQVLETRSEEFYKDAPGDALRPLAGGRSDLFVANGSDWKLLRDEHPLNMPDIDRWMASNFQSMRDVIVDDGQKLADGGRGFDLYPALERIAFDAFAVALCGRELGEETYRRFQGMSATCSLRMTTPLQFLPVLNPLFYSRRRRWYEEFSAILRDAQTAPDLSRSDLCATVQRSKNRVSHDDLVEAVATIFYGGAFSASSAVATAMYLLAGNPDVYEQLVAELDQHDPTSPSFDLQALESCELLDRVLRETLRLRGPVQVYFRNVNRAKSVELGGHTLPANTILLIANSAIHHSETHWREPGRFDPNRWKNGVVEANPLGSAYFFPFGRGPRMCMGHRFGMMYMKLALATLLANFRLEMDPTQPYVPEFFFGCLIPKGLQARFAKRPSKPAIEAAPNRGTIRDA